MHPPQLPDRILKKLAELEETGNLPSIHQNNIYPSDPEEVEQSSSSKIVIPPLPSVSCIPVEPWMVRKGFRMDMDMTVGNEKQDSVPKNSIGDLLEQLMPANDRIDDGDASSYKLLD